MDSGAMVVIDSLDQDNVMDVGKQCDNVKSCPMVHRTVYTAVRPDVKRHLSHIP